MLSDPCSVLPFAIGGQHTCIHENYFQLIMSYVIDVNARHVNGYRNSYIWEAVVYMNIMWILYQTELGLSFLGIRWPVMELWVVAQRNYANCKFCLKYFSNPYTIDKYKWLCLLIVLSKKCNNEMHVINFHCLFIFVCYFFVDSAKLDNLLLLKIS